MALPFELQAAEQVFRVCRRHWVFLATKLAWQAVAGLVPVIALLVVAGFAGASGVVVLVVAVVCLAWGAYWAVRIYFTWYRYQNDIWVITNQRLVDSLKRHWFHHQMASADLVDIEDMTIHKEGVLATLFNYGDLNCQTAGTQSRFVLSAIPGPADVLSIVDASRDAARRELHSAD